MPTNDLTNRLKLLISKHPDLITTTLSNIFTMRLIGNKTQGDIVNDDASVFSDMLPGLARSAARTLNGLVATKLLANAGKFFGTGHANYFEGATTNLQASSLATAIKMLRQMKDVRLRKVSRLWSDQRDAALRTRSAGDSNCAIDLFGNRSKRAVMPRLSHP